MLYLLLLSVVTLAQFVSPPHLNIMITPLISGANDQQASFQDPAFSMLPEVPIVGQPRNGDDATSKQDPAILPQPCATGLSLSSFDVVPLVVPNVVLC